MPLNPPSPPFTLQSLATILSDLRNPVDGCPWDREQDFASIAPYTIEEAYEVADAIERSDMDALRGELGDLLKPSKHPFGPVVERQGSFAGQKPALLAHEQSQLQILFQRANDLADRGLANRHGLGRALHAADGQHIAEDFDLAHGRLAATR